MRIALCIDDTDDLESPGTGQLCSEIGLLIQRSGFGEAGYVTRHQLLVHPDIPYTSHNSAMCLEAKVDPTSLHALTCSVAGFLERSCAPGSDPGLCIVIPEHLPSVTPLVEFGRLAKERVLGKAAAYQLARELGVHLSEHGGTGMGVIGALAGAGLRLSGNDGRLRGSIGIPENAQVLSVRDLLKLPEVEAVCDPAGEALDEADLVSLGPKPKTVLLGGRAVLITVPAGGPGAAKWRSCTNQELKSY